MHSFLQQIFHKHQYCRVFEGLHPSFTHWFPQTWKAGKLQPREVSGEVRTSYQQFILKQCLICGRRKVS